MISNHEEKLERMMSPGFVWKDVVAEERAAAARLWMQWRMRESLGISKGHETRPSHQQRMVILHINSTHHSPSILQGHPLRLDE